MDHLEPKRAVEFLRQHADALFVDCRSEMEYLFVGHPVGALHVAWNDGPDWAVNPHFVGQVKKLAGTNHTTRPVVLICRSGNRSKEAGEELERAGFTYQYLDGSTPGAARAKQRGRHPFRDHARAKAPRRSLSHATIEDPATADDGTPAQTPDPDAAGDG
jgi:rhodanese-related sulfurtransferase